MTFRWVVYGFLAITTGIPALVSTLWLIGYVLPLDTLVPDHSNVAEGIIAIALAGIALVASALVGQGLHDLFGEDNPDL